MIFLDIEGVLIALRDAPSQSELAGVNYGRGGVVGVVRSRTSMGKPGPLTVGGLTGPVLEDHGTARTANALGTAIARWITARTIPQPTHGFGFCG